MNKKLMDTVKRCFYKRLEAKTSWGRNELMKEFEAAISDALLEMLDAE